MRLLKYKRSNIRDTIYILDIIIHNYISKIYSFVSAKKGIKQKKILWNIVC